MNDLWTEYYPLQLLYQKEYCYSKETCLKTDGCKKVYEHLWSFTSSIRESRKMQLHESDCQQELKGLSQVKQAITAEYALGVHCT